ncbi:hypothetical protein V5O48_012745, partial [Marasmius crinis-equi]
FDLHIWCLGRCQLERGNGNSDDDDSDESGSSDKDEEYAPKGKAKVKAPAKKTKGDPRDDDDIEEFDDCDVPRRVQDEISNGEVSVGGHGSEDELPGFQEALHASRADLARIQELEEDDDNVSRPSPTLAALPEAHADSPVTQGKGKAVAAGERGPRYEELLRRHEQSSRVGDSGRPPRVLGVRVGTVRHQRMKAVLELKITLGAGHLRWIVLRVALELCLGTLASQLAQ